MDRLAAAMERFLTERSLRAGQHLWHQGDPSDEVRLRCTMRSFTLCQAPRYLSCQLVTARMCSTSAFTDFLPSLRSCTYWRLALYVST